MTLSQLPSVHQAIQLPLLKDLPHGFAVELARQAISVQRKLLLNGETDLPSIEKLIQEAMQNVLQPKLKPVINATGIIIHTNLGRAPLPQLAVDNIQAVMCGYSNLELELDTGRRGGRLNGVCDRICRLTGAEAAIVVNNCAAATLLAVSATSAGRNMIVSRGELVEIGGSYRIPDVIVQGNAILKSVGTTNRTRLSDYEGAIDSETGALLRVHPSNYRVVGFTERPDRSALAELAAKNSIPLIDDLGSGLLNRAPSVPYAEELVLDESIHKALSDGATLVTFSGDKLLGSAQAGFIVGAADWVEKCRRHPLYRALRVDKLTLAALEGCLILAESHRHHELPVWNMLERSADELYREAEQIAAQLPNAEVTSVMSYSGGGALPDRGLSDWAVKIAHPKAGKIADQLRQGNLPIVLRVSKEALFIHPRTLLDGQALEVVKSLRNVL
ncbi:MAG: L-seryl-tRNA(Sec) selenium transferase [Myxococcota bacterium]|nr:L-seryl-tRNA(Sec) selenium transferase [Myxococcota bacterium]